MTVLQDRTIKPGAGRRYLLRTHLPLFLAADGEVLRDRGMWRDLGEFVTAIVVVGSRRLAGKRSGPVACRASRRHVRPCPGELETELEPRTRHLLWRCPVCGDGGEISGWAETKWDRSKPAARTNAVRASSERTLRRKAAKKKTKNGKSAQGADRS
jgi:hypothetical protein